MHRPLLALLLGCSALLACGDDDAAVDDRATIPTTPADDAATSGPADDGAAPGDDTTVDDATDDATDGGESDDGAAPPPDDAGLPDEGQGDPLVYVADLDGDAEVPGPGDPDGIGRAEIESAADGRLCFDMVANGLDADVVAAHVHEAPAGDSGGVVIGIGTPSSTEGDTDTWTDVCVEVADEVVERMVADASQFYVNVHTETFPDGAVRGQLEAATIFDLELS